MSDTQSDRSVLPLPAELRLKIYRNLVRKTYLALGTTPEHQLSVLHKNWSKPLPASAGLVVLRVSKATSAEALKLLYEESVFLFKLDFTTSFFCNDPPQKAVALMNNVSFEISAKHSAAIAGQAFYISRIIGAGPGPTRQDLMSQRTIELFTGTASFRNVMRIRFMECANSTCYFISQQFDDAMKDLGGFRKLVVEFESARDYMAWYTLDQSLAVSRSQCEESKDIMLRYSFKPVYGPAVQGTVHGASHYACYLEFYPRQYLAKDLILKAAKMLKEAARLAEEERAVASLPKIVETLELL